MGGEIIESRLRGLYKNADETMRRAAAAGIKIVDDLPNAQFAIPESTPDETARGKGRELDQTHIPQFGSGTTFQENVTA
jgi:hypothetical protein